MASAVLDQDGGWVLRREGKTDIAMRHNEWGKTSDKEDMPRVAAALSDIDGLAATARKLIADKMYETWRDAWKTEADDDLDRAAFMEKLVLTGINYPSSKFLHSHVDLNFDDSGMFNGHMFYAMFTLDGTYVDFEMFG